MKQKPYDIVDHTADWALRVYGRTLAELLQNAATGMNSLMVTQIHALAQDQERHVALQADDAETLLVDWLSELAYLAEMELLIFPSIQLHNVTPTSVTATLHGGRVPELQKHIKAVTYHNLEIVETEDGLEVTVVFDV